LWLQPFYFILGVIIVAGEPARQIVAGAEVRHHDLLETL